MGSYGGGNRLHVGLDWQKYKASLEEDQFQSALGSIQVVSIIPFEAGYFLGVPKSFLLAIEMMIS